MERLDAQEAHRVLSARLPGLPAEAWKANTLSNHDVSRSRSHFGDGEHDAAWTRLAAVLTLTLRGSPFIYNGEEIGMQDWPMPSADLFRDNLSVWIYNTVRQQMGLPEAEALQVANLKGRDKCRTPMQWGPGPNGGFCPERVTPWLPVHPNHALGVNVQEQQGDPGSLLHFYRRLIALRRGSPALVHGDMILLDDTALGCLAYMRRVPEQGIVVVLNLRGNRQPVLFQRVKRWLKRVRARCLFSTHQRSGSFEALGGLYLSPYEAYIGELERA